MMWEQKETDFYKKRVNEGNFWFLKLLLRISDEFTRVNTWILFVIVSIVFFLLPVLRMKHKWGRQRKEWALSLSGLVVLVRGVGIGCGLIINVNKHYCHMPCRLIRSYHSSAWWKECCLILTFLFRLSMLSVQFFSSMI